MVRTRVLGRPPGILIFAQACKKLSPILVMIIRMMLLTVMMTRIMRGCTQIPISTFSHIWVFVRLYGIMFVIIVIAIIITIIIKSEGVNAQL